MPGAFGFDAVVARLKVCLPVDKDRDGRNGVVEEDYVDEKFMIVIMCVQCQHEAAKVSNINAVQPTIYRMING